MESIKHHIIIALLLFSGGSSGQKRPLEKRVMEAKGSNISFEDFSTLLVPIKNPSVAMRLSENLSEEASYFNCNKAASKEFLRNHPAQVKAWIYHSKKIKPTPWT